MKELTFVIDWAIHDELKDYLMSLNGISNVIINNDKYLKINIKYDSNLISGKIIEMELFLFLDVTKTPSIISFNKHFKGKLETYIIDKNSICCEYCLKGAIEDLFEIEGIEKVETNFGQKDNNTIINIGYNPKLISIDKMKEIEIELNI